MMELTMLGTGNAHATELYNTCYVIHEHEAKKGGSYFLVDGGGGKQLLTQLKRVGIRFQDCTEMFLTHKHIDHFFGMIWMVRVFAQAMLSGQYEGDAVLYGHDEGIDLIRDIATKLLQKKQYALLGDEHTGRIHLIKVKNGETREVIGHEVTFFDIGSTKAKQFGYSFALSEQERICCCGDEPYNTAAEGYARGAKWLFHEAFCLYADRLKFNPYEKNHSTVRDAAELAERFKIPNLLLYHTEDSDIQHRKSRYSEEAAKYYHGRVLVPDDLETIAL